MRLVRTAVGALTVVAASLLAACGALRSPASIPPGTPVAQARQTLGGASAEYPLAAGGTRLEFARGKETYMLDFDGVGALVASRQVLTPSNFGSITPGMPDADVLARLGHPAFTFGVSRPPTSIWNYRFGGLDGDCVVMQIAIGNSSHRVESVSPNTDPACDRGGDQS